MKRLFLIVSLLGILLTTHLWVQKARGFDQGCFGFGVGAATAEAGCTSPALQPLDQIFGIKTVLLAYVFFSASTILTLGSMLGRDRWSTLFRSGQEILVFTATPLTAYLVVFQFRVGSFCPLCLALAALICALFAGTIVQRWRRAAPSGSTGPDDYVFMATACFGTFSAMAAVVLHGALPEPGSTASRDNVSGLLRTAISDLVASGALKAPAAKSKEATPPAPVVLKPDEWKALGYPFVGTPTGVDIFAFFDPNCPHCSETYRSFMKIAEKYKDRAAFHVFPMPLWAYSMLQIQTLEVTKKNGHYFDLWAAQFAAQKQGGLSMPDLAPMLSRIGVVALDLQKQIADAQPAVLAIRKKATESGIRGTPSLFIDGVQVQMRSEAQFEELIAEKLAARSLGARTE